MSKLLKNTQEWLAKPTPSVSLAFFRILCGLMLFVTVLRFGLKGWVHDFYVAPKFYFTYYGFEWVKPLPEAGMYTLFIILGIAALAIIAGYRYRIAAVTFFLGFTYVELIDKTNYLNHYYFISLLTFLIIWLPLHCTFSIDSLRNPSIKREYVPHWILLVIQMQIGVVYFFGGIAKLNYDWLFRAQPLRIWLSANSGVPIIGGLLDQLWVAYALSWGAMLYDLSIFFLLKWNKTRAWAYAIVLTFHTLTSIFFSIGMFPYIMSVLTLVFFSANVHQHVIGLFQSFARKFRTHTKGNAVKEAPSVASYPVPKFLLAVIVPFFLFQFMMPFRYAFYNSQVWWGEEAFRYSWNIMRIEKTGHVEFIVKDPTTGNTWTELPTKYLTHIQLIQMSTQPDMILQFAHFIADKYKAQGKSVEVYTESYASVNGRPSQLLIDPTIDLAKEKDSFAPKRWVREYSERSVAW